MSEIFQIRGPGSAVRFSAIYAPEPPSPWGRSDKAKFMIVMAADACILPPDLVSFIKKNNLRAQSCYRVRVAPVGRTVAELAEALAGLDATNVGRDRFFRDCREVVAHVAPFSFTYNNTPQGPITGRGLGLNLVEVNW